jgi:hypothetical protein
VGRMLQRVSMVAPLTVRNCVFFDPLGGNEMSTVREATYEVLRSLRMTTISGNPGWNELPFLDRMPSDFRYIFGSA